MNAPRVNAVNDPKHKTRFPTLEPSALHSPAPSTAAATHGNRSIRAGISPLPAHYGRRGRGPRQRDDPGDARRAPAPAEGRRVNRTGRIALVVGLVAVVLMAFRVSWNALSDVARAIGADSTAALLYPVVVDGLMALALVAALVLTGTDRKFALRVLAAYTIASLLLNYVHGLVPALHTESVQWGRLADWAPANWALVLLATSLPVGSIYFGSDLVAKVLHHIPESAAPAETAPDQSGDPEADKSASEEAPQSRSDQAEPDPGQPTESPALKVTEPPATRPTEPDAPAPAPAARAPRSAAVAESTGSAPRRATGRVPAAAKPTPNRTRTAAEVLREARLLTAGWSDDELNAERLRTTLRIGQKPARLLRDQLQAERADQTQPVADSGINAGLLGEAAAPADTV